MYRLTRDVWRVTWDKSVRGTYESVETQRERWWSAN
jgi:hypothetical protein